MAEKREGKGTFTQQAVVRIGFILICIVVAFAFVRQLFVPASFGEFGRYRGASVSEVASRSITYAGGGNNVCAQCHQDKVQALSQAQHGTMDCQTCHGPAAKHIKKPADQSLAIQGSVELCGACHRDIAGRTDGQIATVRLEMHSGGVDCIRCHDPHQPWAKLGGRRS